LSAYLTLPHLGLKTIFQPNYLKMLSRKSSIEIFYLPNTLIEKVDTPGNCTQDDTTKKCGIVSSAG